MCNRFQRPPLLARALTLVLLAAACTATPAPEDRTPDTDAQTPAEPGRRPDGAAPPAPAPDADRGNDARTMDAADRADSGAADAAADRAAPAGDAAETPAAPDGGAPPASYADVSKPSPGRVLPFIFIEATKSIPASTAEKIPATIKIVEDHDGKVDRNDLKPLLARPVALTAAVGINRHGNASDWYSDKKGYNLELRDEKGADRELPVVGLPPGSDWVLYACYNDKTCLRNVMTYDLGRQMGRWAPRTRFVEVALNGSYLGLYVVVERIRRDRFRVDVPKVSDDPAAADLSGGYIWKVDSPVDSPRDRREWQTAGGGLWWGYHYPKWDQITEPQRKGLHAEVAAFEAAMKSPSFADPKTGYAAAIDVPSFVDYLLLQELSYNVDGIWRSAYFHKQSRANGNKVYAGPLWDFDLAYGNADFRDAWLPEKGWQHVDYPKYLATVDPADLRKYRYIFDVWKKLFDDPTFNGALKCRWKELRAGPLDLTKLFARVDDWLKETAPAVTRDRARWSVAGKDLFGNWAVFQTHAEDVKYFKDFISKRVRWLDGKLAGCAAP